MLPKAQKRPNTTKDGDRSTKRTRFEEPGPSSSNSRGAGPSDAALEAAFDEQVLADLEDVSSAFNRRGAVKVEGYDSDSSDDGEGVVLSRRSGANSIEEDEDDMFAPSGSTNDNTSESSKKPLQKFLALGDIEGQEFSNPNPSAPDHDDEDVENFEDEDARERRLKEGMGFEMSSFNMKAEMEEGKFAEDGTFHRTFDPHGVHDKWMDGIDEREIHKARRVKKKMEERELQRVHDEEISIQNKDHLSKHLVSLLHKGETVLEALQRLGKTTKQKKSNVPSRPHKSSGQATNATPSISSSMNVDEPPTNHKEPSPIDQITSLASTLMSLGNIDIYDETYESLLRSVRRSGIVSPDWAPPAPRTSGGKYEYRWTPSYLAISGGGTSVSDIFGPFGSDELLGWKGAKYFGEHGDRIQIRRVGDEDWGGWDVLL